MATLKTKPGSSTAKQRKAIAIEGKRRGMTIDRLREMAGCRLHELSSKDASALITRLTDRGLPNPPGKKPKAYPRKKKTDATRMITQDQCDQIKRLALDYFGENAPALAWLKLNFNADIVRDLATAKRAGEVIAVLKGMHERRKMNSHQ